MDNARNEHLKKLQCYTFAAWDMLLYLDTHPEDRRAFEMFSDLVKKAKECKEEFENRHGPLSAFGAARFSEFKWLDNPWPWEKGGNADV